MRVGIVSADRTNAAGSPWNLGDAFLTDVMLTQLGEWGHEASAIDFGGARERGSMPRKVGHGLRGLRAFVRSVDLVIIGGGTMLQDDDTQHIFGGLPRLCLATKVTALEARVPVAFYAVGCDTINRVVPRLALAIAVRRSPVWVRDEGSLHRAKHILEAKHAHLSADAALLPAADRLLSPYQDASSESSGVVIAANYVHEKQITPAFLDTVRDEARVLPTILGMSSGGHLTDVTEHSRAVSSGHAVIATTSMGWRSAASSISSARGVIASRMHALYLAALLEKPMAAVGRGEKVRAFAHEFSVPHFETFTPEIIHQMRPASVTAIAAARSRSRESLSSLIAHFSIEP